MYFPGSRIDLEEISNNTRIINGRMPDPAYRPFIISFNLNYFDLLSFIT